jgi:hypothetical protein
VSNLQRASVSDLRKARMLSDALIKAGIDFVPVPVKSVDHKIKLTISVMNELDKLEKDAEKNERK